MAVELNKNRMRTWKEEGIRAGLFLAAAVSIFTTVGIVVVLATESSTFFEHVSFSEFLFGTKWTPLLEPRHYGILPLVCGTMLIVGGAALLAIPVGLMSAIYLSEFASARIRGIFKPLLEVLAGIPTVVYGFFALTFITPLLKQVLPSTEVFNAASASIVVGIMILPMIASLCDDALSAVPRAMRNAGYAVGATPYEVTTRVVVPAAASGIFASFVLAISRAIGETMAVALAAGATAKMTLNPLESVQTMTAYIVSVSTGDLEAGSVRYQSIFAVAALLFIMTLIMNVISNRVMRRFREVYE